MSRNHVAVRAFAFLAEPLDERCGVGDFAATLHERLALLDRHEHGEIFLIRHHEIEPLAQNLRAFLRRACAPIRQRFLSGLDRPACFRRAEVRHGSDRLAGRGIDDLFRLTSAGTLPAAADERLFAKQTQIAKRELRLR